MLEIQKTYHIDRVTYVDFTLDGKSGVAGLQLPYSQTSRCGIKFDGSGLKEGALYQWFLINLMLELRHLYPDPVKRSLFYAGCDIDNIENIEREWEGPRKYIVEFKDGTKEIYREISGNICIEGFYLVKEN